MPMGHTSVTQVSLYLFFLFQSLMLTIELEILNRFWVFLSLFY